MDRVTTLFLNHRVGVDMANAIASFVGPPRRAPPRAAAMAGTIRRRAQEDDYSGAAFESLLRDPRDAKRVSMEEVRSVLYSTVDPSLVSAALFGELDLDVYKNMADLLFSMDWEFILVDALPPLDSRRPRTLEEEECVAEATQMNFERHSTF